MKHALTLFACSLCRRKRGPIKRGESLIISGLKMGGRSGSRTEHAVVFYSEGASPCRAKRRRHSSTGGIVVPSCQANSRFGIPSGRRQHDSRTEHDGLRWDDLSFGNCLLAHLREKGSFSA
jgi:hypothetical protein